MPKVRAVLLDVFDTVLTVDFDAALGGLVGASGLARDDWVAGFTMHRQNIMTGAVTLEQAFAATFELAGEAPRDLSALIRRDVELLQEHATLYADVIPFIDEVRRRGISVAFVSNCTPNTGPLLQELGLADHADHVVLSYEVGSAKPDAAIYRAALGALSVNPAEAVFVDDQAAYCSGAEELGMTAVRIDRHSDMPMPGLVHSLRDVLPIL